MRRSGLLVFAVLSSGCFWNNGAATDSYHRQVTTASLRVAQLEATVAEAESRVSQLEETMRRQGEEKVTQLETIEEVNTEIARIRGEIELVRRDVDDLRAMFETAELSGEKRRLHMERRIGAVEELFGLTPPPPPTDEELGIASAEPVPGTEPEPEVEGSPPDGPVPEPVDEPTTGLETAEDYLEKAVQLMTEGTNKGARALLETASKRFGGAAEMPEIRYRVAETYFNDGQYNSAIKIFQEVVTNWPESEWAPWSTLRTGDAFSEQNQPDNARLFYEEVIRVYPKSEAAREAKQLLGR